jgi:hypothetical protein
MVALLKAAIDEGLCEVPNFKPNIFSSSGIIVLCTLGE